MEITQTQNTYFKTKKMNFYKSSFNNFFVMLLALIFLTNCQQQEVDNTPWVSLFDNESLTGWTQMGGKAKYQVRDGAIVGATVYKTPNSFLTTDKLYDDFILELEYKVDSTMNSGIQIRSNSFPYYNNGQVHGYQIEIDPSDRAWSAGVYEEGGRGWLVPLTDNPEGQKAFKQNDWNHYRIEAIGDTIKTWINGVPAAHLIDDKTASGFIGLQVHSIGEDKTEGTEVIWKNIKILTEDLSKYAQKTSLPPVVTLNKITTEEQKNDWRLLWDGKTTEGWRGAKLEAFPEAGWEIEDGILTVLASDGEESTGGGDIVTKELYGEFELKVDFRLTKGANSGIKYYVDTELNKGTGSAIGLEFQILDDAVHPDAKLGNHEGSRTVASLYDLIQANPEKHVNPIGEWNTSHIIAKNNHVEHWLNGMKVLEYERKSADYRKLVAESKYVTWKNFGESDKGHLLLQEHGDRVSFRNVKIKEY
jgi:hypothetical protein